MKTHTLAIKGMGSNHCVMVEKTSSANMKAPKWKALKSARQRFV